MTILVFDSLIGKLDVTNLGGQLSVFYVVLMMTLRKLFAKLRIKRFQGQLKTFCNCFMPDA